MPGSQIMPKWILFLSCCLANGFRVPGRTPCRVVKSGTTTIPPSPSRRKPQHGDALWQSSASSLDHDVSERGVTWKSEDSIERFAQDITHVLGTLRSTEDDPSIPRLFHRRSRSPTFTHPWTTSDWEKHYTRWRFLNYLKDFPSSRIVKRVAPQWSLLLCWSIFIAWHPAIMGSSSFSTQLFAKAALPLTPLSLVSTFVADLLTLRTNQCLSRLSEARVAMGHVVTYTRQMAQLIAVIVYPKDARLGLLAARHVALYTWLLRALLRGLDSTEVDKDLICAMLPPCKTRTNKEDVPSPSAAYILAHIKKPMAVLTVLRQIFASLRTELTVSEAQSLERTVQELNESTFTTERLLASPIPPLYSAHTGRLLMFNLFFLPLALRGSLSRVAVVIATAAVGFAMLGLDEISHLLENPFRLMPLWYLSKNAMKEAGDALVCQPPSLTVALNGRQSVGNSQFAIPPYW